jgi:hypothetical protein
VSSSPQHDLTDWIAAVERRVALHAIGEPGAYRRWLSANEALGRTDTVDPYGCADAANILYTLDRFPREPAERESWVRTLRALQDPETGLYQEPTHHPIHTTAHCLAALELFDAGPAHPLAALAELREPEAMEGYLEALDWTANPWTESHRGAGLYAALWLAGEATEAFVDRYFAWLAERCDPATGLWRVGHLPPPGGDGTDLFPHLAGTFHYLFNLQHARRPLPHPEALVDTCLRVVDERLFPLAHFLGFSEVDWVYCTSRALAQSGHRRDDCRRALRSFAGAYIEFLRDLDLESDERAGDLHALFGGLCAIAELQRALPGEIRTPRPLRLVLDRRPFI